MLESITNTGHSLTHVTQIIQSPDPQSTLLGVQLQETWFINTLNVEPYVDS